MEKLPVPGEDLGQARITEYRFKKQGIEISASLTADNNSLQKVNRQTFRVVVY